MPTQKQTAFIIQKDWRWSSEVWSTMFWIFVAGFIAGLIAFAYVTHKATPTPSATVTVTVTSAP